DHHSHSFVEVREENAVHEETGTVRHHDRNLAELAHEIYQWGNGLVVCALRANHFHELHPVNGVEEVQPGDAPGMRDPVAEPRYRERRRVRSEYSGVADSLRELAKDLPLHVLALDDRFNDKIDIRKRRPFTRGGDVPNSRFRLGTREGALRHR